MFHLSLLTQLLYIFASVMCFISVAFGAWGAHGLPKALQKKHSDHEKIQRYLNHWEKAVKYQMYHGLGILLSLILISLFSQNPSTFWIITIPGFLSIGTLLFSGSLYLIVLKDKPKMGHITPIGGVFFLLGWLCFIIFFILHST